jgi:hypothetical protein
MNNYITLDDKKYKCPAKQWQPVTTKPNSVRVTLLGEVDVTFGSATIREWQGQIEGPVSVPDGTWGTVDDLRATLAKRQELPLIDHFGISHTVVCIGPFKEEPFMSMWDSASNHFNVSARIIKVR